MNVESKDKPSVLNKPILGTFEGECADANITNNDFTNVRLNGVISFYRTYAYDTTALPIYWN